MNFRKMLETFRAFRAGAPLGDVAVLKFDALSAPPMWLTAKLQPLRGYAPTQDLSVLRALPAGSLGREYARFLDANGITPLVVSPHIKERFHDNPYVLRYAATHDLHHVLTGFDTGLAGEAGVFAFTIAQGSAPAGRGMLQVVRILYAIFSPTQARKVWHNIRVGLAQGAAAKLVIAEPIEAYFEEPLLEVRRKLDLGDPQRVGVLPSGKSSLASLVYGPKKPTLPPAPGRA
jgi:ubiquinone biosynthesis protein COQ4